MGWLKPLRLAAVLHPLKSLPPAAHGQIPVGYPASLSKLLALAVAVEVHRRRGLVMVGLVEVEAVMPQNLFLTLLLAPHRRSQ